MRVTVWAMVLRRRVAPDSITGNVDHSCLDNPATGMYGPTMRFVRPGSGGGGIRTHDRGEPPMPVFKIWRSSSSLGSASVDTRVRAELARRLGVAPEALPRRRDTSGYWTEVRYLAAMRAFIEELAHI